MQISEICQLTGLTKKAIEYYQGKGLVSPLIQENGYREFSHDDVEKLRAIALFRKLDLTTDEIKQVLESNDKKSALMMVKQVKQIQAQARLTRIELLEELVHNENMEMILDKISILEQQASIKEKLLMSFPGYYGHYISFHFGQFLNEPIKTDEQKRMYAVIVEFLDNMESLEIPEELQPLLDQVGQYTDDRLETLSLNVQIAFDDFETYWENYKESIAQYVEFKKSESFQNSGLAQLMYLFRQFGETSGYYEVFIPAMRKLSPSYDAYYTKMLQANEKLVEKMPELENWKYFQSRSSGV
ncbi:MAG TPA: MerR family transcriptional regulator [Desulfitobacterium dehalogenans]|uniref:MerR family transcriptional regulator n=1 Tax=Desulfitobacterium dehalogenans TaxID=36854 RepID=A0A7C6Z570_9FIRM|nr:MerR family transcriptional regulator [Desulfitobacterium dehalogenans]